MHRPADARGRRFGEIAERVRKKARPYFRDEPFIRVLSTCYGLALGNRAYGAAASTGTAVNASVRVDNILAVTGRDRADRALALARTAADASVRNYICHGKAPPD